jgi:hypothetical protein
MPLKYFFIRRKKYYINQYLKKFTGIKYFSKSVINPLSHQKIAKMTRNANRPLFIHG